MTLIKIKTQIVVVFFIQSLLDGAGSQTLKTNKQTKKMLTCLGGNGVAPSRRRILRSSFLFPGPVCRLLTPRVHVDEARAWERGCVHKIVVVISSRRVSHRPTQRFRCVSRTDSRSSADNSGGCAISTELSAASDAKNTTVFDEKARTDELLLLQRHKKTVLRQMHSILLCCSHV